MASMKICKIENCNDIMRCNVYYSVSPPFDFKALYTRSVDQIEVTRMGLISVESKVANCFPVGDPCVLIDGIVKEDGDGIFTVGLCFKVPKDRDNTSKLLAIYNSLEENIKMMGERMLPLYPTPLPLQLQLPWVDSGPLQSISKRKRKINKRGRERKTFKRARHI